MRGWLGEREGRVGTLLHFGVKADGRGAASRDDERRVWVRSSVDWGEKRSVGKGSLAG